MKLAPIDCETNDQVCQLERDNIEFGKRWSIFVDGLEVHFSDQRVGSPPLQTISIPKEHFDKLIAWYMAKQTVQDQKNAIA